MSGENSRETKNLGLIQAIYVGVNPPLNTKIIWYDDNLGIKIHKYYNEENSRWEVFGNNDLLIQGVYTYLAYATDCEGSGFSLNKEDIHTHISIVTSNNPIPLASLNQELFEERWIKICDGSNYKYNYIAFADDCEGVNFSLSPTYTEECDDCRIFDNYSLITDISTAPKLEILTLTPVNNGFDLRIKGLTPNIIEVNVKDIENKPLLDYLEYCIKVNTNGDYDKAIALSLDGNEQGGYVIQPSNTNTFFKLVKNNFGSVLYIKFITAGEIDTTINFSVSTKNCFNEEPLLTVTKARKCFSFITLDEELTDEQLTPELFENRWICICNENNYDNGDLLEALNNLSLIVNNNNIRTIEEINRLQRLLETLETKVDNNLITTNQNITNLSNSVSNSLRIINENIDTLNSNLNILKQEVEENSLNLSDPTFRDRVLEIVGNNGGNSGEGFDLETFLNSSHIDLIWKSGDVFLDKPSPFLITAGVTNNIYKRTGFIGNGQITHNLNTGFLNYQIYSQDNPPIIKNETNFWKVDSISNLLIKVKDETWERIKDYKTEIIITRYKNSKNKGRLNRDNISRTFRHSGFKKSNLNLIFTPNSIPIKSNYQVLDLGQENYFKLAKEMITANDFIDNFKGFRVRGLSNNFCSVRVKQDDEFTITKVYKAWVYLEFSLKVESDNGVIQTKPLNRVKMTLTVEQLKVKADNNLQIKQNKIDFKLT